MKAREFSSLDSAFLSTILKDLGDAATLLGSSVNDFIPATELAQLTGFAIKSIYHQHCTRRGALVPILSKMGSRLGCWRADYNTWKASQRKLPDTVQ